MDQISNYCFKTGIIFQWLEIRIKRLQVVKIKVKREYGLAKHINVMIVMIGDNG